jgi:hypothetical protein
MLEKAPRPEQKSILRDISRDSRGNLVREENISRILGKLGRWQLRLNRGVALDFEIYPLVVSNFL